jgi:hypothetical protein
VNTIEEGVRFAEDFSSVAGTAVSPAFVEPLTPSSRELTPLQSLRPLVLPAAVAVVLVGLAGTGARAVTIDWVTVGDPGNANDTINTGTNPNFGAVGYAYRIGRHEVTIQQYTDCLNAAAKSDPYSLYDTRMGTNLNIAGIARAGTSGSYVYTVMSNAGASGDRPIAYVT